MALGLSGRSDRLDVVREGSNMLPGVRSLLVTLILLWDPNVPQCCSKLINHAKSAEE